MKLDVVLCVNAEGPPVLGMENLAGLLIPLSDSNICTCLTNITRRLYAHLRILSRRYRKDDKKSRNWS